MEDSGFTTEGHESFPNIHSDYEQVHEFSLWPQEALEERFTEYSSFLERKDLMPRAREYAGRVAAHLVFELMYRKGFFSKEEDM